MEVLEVVAASRFLHQSANLQLTCVALANVCRETIPSRMRVNALSPRRVLAIAGLIPFSLKENAGDDTQSVLQQESRVSNKRRIQRLRIEGNFPLRGEHVTLPSGLDTLELSGEFDYSLEGVKWPEKLGRLLISGVFDQFLTNVEFPQHLRQLGLGGNFRGQITGVDWPSTLEKITVGPYFCACSCITCRCMDTIKSYDHELDLELEMMAHTGDAPIDRSISNITWPGGLKVIELLNYFEGSVRDVKWPRGLLRLKLGPFFNESLEGIHWPSELEDLSLQGVDQPLGRVKWPCRLRYLTFGRFDHEIEDAMWPNMLEELDLGDVFDRSITLCDFPPSLRKLRLGNEFSESICDNESLNSRASGDEVEIIAPHSYNVF